MKRSILIKSSILLLTIATITSSCARRKVTRIDPDRVTDLSGRWNNTDARLTAETIADQALTGRWLNEFILSKNQRPVIVVGTIRNNSHEHIDTEIFIKDIERAFLKSQSIRLVQAGDKRNELRGERADQQDFASTSTMKRWGQELGADFIMQGSVKSIVDSYRRERTTYWQVDIELTNLETNEIVWIGDYKGKKYILR
jgi:uncharacterized protein (TIGR02722 family)